MMISRSRLMVMSAVLAIALSTTSCGSNTTSEKSLSTSSKTSSEIEKAKSALFQKHMDLMGAKDYQGAINVSNEMIKLEPSFGYKLRQEVYLREGKYQQAEKDILEAIRLDPSNFSLYEYSAIAATRLGHYKEAIERAEESVKRCPADNQPATALFCMGIAHHKLGDVQKAIEDMSKSIAISPSNPEAFYLRGSFYDAAGNRQKALDDFASALTWDPDLQSAYKRRAVIFIRMGQEGKANRELAQAKERLRSKMLRGSIEWIPPDLTAEQMRLLVKNPKANV